MAATGDWLKRGRHDSPSPPSHRYGSRHDSPSPSPPSHQRGRHDSFSSDNGGGDDDSSDEEGHPRKDKKKKGKKEKKREKKMKKREKKERKERKGSKKKRRREEAGSDHSGTDIDPDGDAHDAAATAAARKKVRTVDEKGVVTESYGDGGRITYPADWIFEDGKSAANGSVTVEPAKTQEVKMTNQNDFFAALRAQEHTKAPVGTVHATGKQIGMAVSGQGIMAGVRTSTIRPTGMGGGAVPASQAQLKETGEWPCLKCGTNNHRNETQCKNCTAMRRMVR